MTPPELSALQLTADYEDALLAEDASRWSLTKPGPLEVLVTVSPLRAPGETFQARLAWTAYPDEPPSLKFRDPATGRLDLPSSWPQVPGFRPGNLDACVNWCAEGFALHQEWKVDPNLRWRTEGNVLLMVVRTLQSQLDEQFAGRHP